MLLTLSYIDRAHCSETREKPLGTPPPPTAINGVRLLCEHANERSGDVDAIKEHFCSAGRCDDSFMRV